MKTSAAFNLVLCAASLFQTQSQDDIWKKVAKVAHSSTETQLDRIEKALIRQGILDSVKDVPPPAKEEAVPKITYRSVTTWERQPYTVRVKVCYGNYCGWELRTRYKMVKVTKSVPVMPQMSSASIVGEAPPPQKPKRYTVKSEPVYYRQWSRYSAWTWPGDLRKHLAGSPHNMDRNWLATATPTQLISAHTAWHNRYGSR